MSTNQIFLPPTGISHDVLLDNIHEDNFLTQVTYKGANGTWAYISRFNGKRSWTVSVAYQNEAKGRIIEVDLKRSNAIFAACRHCEQ